MENKIEINKSKLVSQNYKPLKNQLSKILENQKINKEKQDEI